MFAPLVIPFYITCAGLLLWLIICVAKFRQSKRFVIAIILGFVLFVPSCVGVALVTDMFRYGEFHYKLGKHAISGRVQLPPTARNIILHRTGASHVARFECTEAELLAWLANYRARWSYARPPSTSEERFAAPRPVHDSYMQQHFPELHVQRLWHGPIADNGATFTVFQATSPTIFYVSSNYW